MPHTPLALPSTVACSGQVFVEPTWADRATATWSHFGTTLVFGALLTLLPFIIPATAVSLSGIIVTALAGIMWFPAFFYLVAVWFVVAPGASWLFLLTHSPSSRVPVLIRADVEPRVGTALHGHVRPRLGDAMVFATVRVCVRAGTLVLLIGLFAVPHWVFELAGHEVPDIATDFLVAVSMCCALLSMSWPLRIMESGVKGTRLAYTATRRAQP